MNARENARADAKAELAIIIQRIESKPAFRGKTQMVRDLKRIQGRAYLR